MTNTTHRPDTLHRGSFPLKYNLLASYLGDCDDANVLCEARAAVARPPQPRENAAKALGPNAPVDGVRRWRRGARDPATAFE